MVRPFIFYRVHGLGKQQKVGAGRRPLLPFADYREKPPTGREESAHTEELPGCSDAWLDHTADTQDQTGA
jgi:hypothetical protein